MGALVPSPPALLPVNPSVPRSIGRRLLWLSDEARSMGIHLMGGKGSGKSRLMGRVIAWLDFVRGVPQVILDPNGATIDNFLDKLTRLPKAYQGRLWPRVLYCDLSAKHGQVTPFPLFYRLGNETHNDVASRYLEVLFRLDPKLTEAPILGWNAVTKIGRRAGIVLAALGYQITEMPHLLDYPERWTGKLASIPANQPEVADAASFFLEEYLKWKPRERDLGAGSLRVKLDPFVLDPGMRAMFGADQPGIIWQEVVDRRLTVLLDFRDELNIENRRFKMLWAFLSLLEFIKHRGLGRHQPVGLVIDELTALYNFDAAAGSNVFAADLDELINVVARNYSVWLTLSHQELFQLDQKSRKTLMAMGMQVLGVTSDFEAALSLAGEFFPVDPWRIKRFQKVILPPRRFSSGESEILDLNPVELTVEEQQHLAAHHFKSLKPFEFLVRPASGEGDLTGMIIPIRITDLDKGIWNDEHLLKQARQLLSRRDGLAVADVLARIDERQRLLTLPTLPQPQTRSNDRGTLKIRENLPVHQPQQQRLPAAGAAEQPQATTSSASRGVDDDDQPIRPRRKAP